MDRTTAMNARADLFGPGKPGYHYNDDIPGMDSTYNTPSAMNAFQEEILGVIEGFGLDPDDSDLKQLFKAIKVGLGLGIGAVATITASTALTPEQRGLIPVDATAGDLTLTLPSAAIPLDYIIKRLDNSGNKVIVQCLGAEKILHNTHVNAAGYGFIRLFGAGDFWWLRSNQAAAWWPLMRLDPTPVGRMPTESGTVIPPGGYTKPNGTILTRADYPWLWDYAGVSGNIHADASWSTNRNGGYSTGDGVTTFRVMEIRGEFIRIYDDGRGVDAGRAMGSPQDSQNLEHAHNFTTSENESGAGFAASGPNANYTAVTASSGGAEARPRNIPLPKLLKII